MLSSLEIRGTEIQPCPIGASTVRADTAGRELAGNDRFYASGSCPTSPRSVIVFSTNRQRSDCDEQSAV